MVSIHNPYTDLWSDSTLIPRSKLFWFALVLSAFLFLTGRFVVTGPMAAIMGVWSLSILFGTLVGYALFRVWYHYGA